MDRRDIFLAIDGGEIADLVANTDTADDLNEVHNALFRRALEAGVLKEELVRRIDEASYEAAHNSLLDVRDLKQMSRKTLEDYDPELAVQVYRAQINAMYGAFEEMKEQHDAGLDKPEEELFNDMAFGQTLSTAALDGTPAVSAFTALAKFEGENLRFGRIRQDRAYAHLKENPRAIFTAVGPSNDPTKYDFVTIDVELVEDFSEGEQVELAREEFGHAVKNLMTFKVTELSLVHLPKPESAR